MVPCLSLCKSPIAFSRANVVFSTRASLANVVRIPYAKQLLSNHDYLYNATDLSIWSLLECALGLTATSLAMLRPLFVRLRVFSTTRMRSVFQSKSRTGGRHGTHEQSTARDKSHHDQAVGQDTLGEHSKSLALHSISSESQGSSKAQPTTTTFSPPQRDAVSIISSEFPAWIPRSPEARRQSRGRGESTLSWDSRGHWKLRAPPAGILAGRKRSTRQEGDWFELSPPPPLFDRVAHPHARAYSA